MNVVKSPLVSIIVPVYNVEQYLDECLNSIRGQTYENLEIIVVEDCSTDSSLQVLKHHLEDNRMRYIQHEQNGGLSAARNTGIEAATGEFMMFVDSDDIVDVRLVEVCEACAQSTGADVIVFDYVTFRDGDPLPAMVQPDDVEITGPVADLAYFRLPQFAWLKFIRADLLLKPRLRFPVGYYYEDWPFHWELGFVARNIQRLQFAGCQYRLRGDSITGSGGQKLLHITKSQKLVAEVVAWHGASESVRCVLAQKVYSGVWFVLTNIEPSLLPDAARSTRDDLATMADVLKYHEAKHLKGFMVSAILKIPDPLGLLALRFLCQTVNWISPARRSRRRELASH